MLVFEEREKPKYQEEDDNLQQIFSTRIDRIEEGSH